jgi:hypothetical protein
LITDKTLDLGSMKLIAWFKLDVIHVQAIVFQNCLRIVVVQIIFFQLYIAEYLLVFI